MERISYEMLKKTVNADAVVSSFSWNEMDVTVKRFLNMGEMLDFTNSVVNSCFNSKTGEYRPEIKDFAVRSCILEIYANFDLPEDLVERYDLIYQSNVIMDVMKYIDQAQFNVIMMAIDNKIDAKISTNIAKFEQEMREMRSELDSEYAYIKSIFEGIDNETVNQIASAISNTEIDFEKLAAIAVEANIRARMAENESGSK